MKINWEITQKDVDKLKLFLSQQNNSFVARRISRNVNRQNIELNKDIILKGIIMCLLTSNQRAGPNSTVSNFLRQVPFPITMKLLNKKQSISVFIRNLMLKNGLNRFINKIPDNFEKNFHLLEMTNWQMMELFKTIMNETNVKNERKIADMIDDTYFGFGPKQSRNLMQSLGLTKYEIPLDSRTTKWLNKFGFPLTLSSSALQDKNYYHFVLDGLKLLCDKADILPCVLDAAIFSSYDNGEWTEKNAIF